MGAVTAARKQQSTDDLKGRLLTGSALNFIAVGFNQGSTLVANVFVARILGKQVFGDYTMLLTTLLTLVTLAQLAMGNTATKFAAEYRSTDRERAGQVLAMTLNITLLATVIVTTILLLGASTIAQVSLGRPGLTVPLMIGVGYLCFSTINGFQIGALSGLEDYKGLAISGVLTGTVGVALIAFGARYYGLEGALLGLSLTAISRCIFHYYSLRKEMRIQAIRMTWSVPEDVRTQVLNYALPAIASGYVLFPIGYWTNAMLFQQPNGQSEMAVFGAANNLRTLAISLPNVINMVGLAVLNHTMRNRGHAAYRKVNNYSTGAMVGSAAVAAGGILLGGPLLLHFFGKEFRVGLLPLAILLASTLPESLSMGFRQHIQSRAKMWTWLVAVILPWQVVYFLVTWLAVPVYGAVGLASAYLVGTLVYALSSGLVARNIKEATA